ncbi:MAG: thioredoxin fold domain-containing protein [Bacteroidetes bacterium]|nr:thioredoxin fold domain-containing protein [Bacteroidota bacterium]
MFKAGFLLFTLIILSLSVKAQFGGEKDLVKINYYTSFDKVYQDSELKIAAELEIAETWHINSSSPNEDFLIPSEFELKNENGITLEKVNYPEAVNVEFGFSDKPVSVYEGKALVLGFVKIPAGIAVGTYDLILEFTYQACNDMSCMAPKTLIDTLTIEVVDNQSPINKQHSEVFSQFVSDEVAVDSAVEEDSLASTLESSGLFLSLLIVFIGGLALNLTPCVYPLIPITVGYFGGQSEGSTGRLFFLGVLYVLGMALTYSVVGVVTSLSGAIFGSLLQSPFVIIGIAAVLVALSLSMFGLYEFKMPDKWVMKAGGAKSGAYGAFFMGLTLGIVAAPCIGPFVLGLVTYVAAKGDPVHGFLMFFTLAVGMGTPYLFLALFSGKIKSLPRAGFWMNAIKHIFGFILIGMAIYFLLPILPEPISTFALPVYMILASLYMIFMDKLANNIKGFRIFKTVFAFSIIVLAIYLMWPVEKASPEWEYFTDAKYEQSINGNEKMIIDFYADWCIPCKELDALTFSDSRVINKLKEFGTYKVDMTQTMSDETETMRNKFNIIGMPTVIIINSNGKETERLTGYVTADEFLEMIEKVK